MRTGFCVEAEPGMHPPPSAARLLSSPEPLGVCGSGARPRPGAAVFVPGFPSAENASRARCQRRNLYAGEKNGKRSVFCCEETCIELSPVLWEISSEGTTPA